MECFREGLNLSREAFAGKLGVSGQSVFRWESGRSHPRRWVVQRMESLRKKAVKNARPVEKPLGRFDDVLDCQAGLFQKGF
ncbi:MAG: helix-turn-helix domain-containing protein [Planctomycetes bacterium]|nr:helix-turn-helix domain-containing protein [Planctomycetota bacterium]